MFNLTFVLVLIVLMTVVSLVTALVIEAVKKIVSDDALKRIFGSLEVFSLIFTLFIAIVTYLVFLLFYPLVITGVLDVLKLLAIGIIFAFACGCGSQVGYDKVIKVIKQIIELLKASLCG